MTALDFRVLQVRAEPHAAIPTLLFRLRLTEASGAPIHALALRCQLRIEPNRRSYAGGEQERLFELFGEAAGWGEALHPFLWTHASATVPGFSGSTEFDLPIECTYDFEVTAAKYLHSLADGEVPLLFLFSGTIFCKGTSGFAVEPLSWGSEARFRLPVAVWRELMDCYFPNSGWLRLSRETIDGLRAFRADRALPSLELAIEQLLKLAGD